jgi:hypothetical protein
MDETEIYPTTSGVFYCLLNSSKAETAYCSGHQQHKQCILSSTHKAPMLRRLSLGLLASAISVASVPAIAQEDGSAEDIGVMSISLKDVVKPSIGFQGALQGAGTPNQAGIGASCLSLLDYGNYSSIINTTVAGTTISTSSRLGYRWLNSNRSWMYGLNAGYDSRPMATGPTDTGIPTFGTEKTVFFQQVAVNAEAVSNRWRLSAYGLIPVGEEDNQLNWYYKSGALQTYGLDAGYNITPSLLASAGSYYQNGDVNDDGNPEVDGFGIQGRLAYEISSGLTAGMNVSYDKAFDTRVSADIKVRFGGASTTAKRKAVQQLPVINALTSIPSNRDVRVHDILVIDSGQKK